MMGDFFTGCTNGVGLNDTHGLPSCGYVPPVAEDPESKTERTNHDGDWTFNNLYCSLRLLLLLLFRAWRRHYANSDVLSLPQLRNAGLSCRFVRVDMSSSFRKGCVRNDVYPIPELERSRLASRFCNWMGNHSLDNDSIQNKSLIIFNAEGNSVTSATAYSIACKLLQKPLAIRKQYFE